MEVKVIQPTLPALSQDAPQRPPVLRVAAYCRVSTDSDEQLTSYESQRNHYVSYIAEHDDWQLAGIYADAGISGTQATRRPQFLALIDACERGQIDLVITKSISRFARNTMDCLTYIRQLKQLGIPVIFEKESINTMEASGEVLITILASLAQQESASISQNVKMGIRYVMKEGRGRVNYTRFLGYTKGPTPGSLVIVPHEADVVRYIYRSYLDGYSPQLIASDLEARGIRAPSGGTRWHASTIASMLRNEKYCGDLLMQKYYTPDFLTHKIVRNNGELPQYLVRDHHQPIVPKAVFLQVQAERKLRSSMRDDPSSLRFGSRNALARRMRCACCGAVLKRVRGTRGTQSVWRCESRLAGTGLPACTASDVPEVAARTALAQAFAQLPSHRGQLTSDARRLWLQTRLQEQGSLACARLAKRAMQVRMLLELIDFMTLGMPLVPLLQGGGEEPTAGDPSTPMTCNNSFLPAWCDDYEQFFARTRHLPVVLRNDTGSDLVQFDDTTIVRYLESLVVGDGWFEIVYKAGLRIRVSTPSA